MWSLDAPWTNFRVLLQTFYMSCRFARCWPRLYSHQTALLQRTLIWNSADYSPSPRQPRISGTAISNHNWENDVIDHRFHRAKRDLWVLESQYCSRAVYESKVVSMIFPTEVDDLKIQAMHTNVIPSETGCTLSLLYLKMSGCFNSFSYFLPHTTCNLHIYFSVWGVVEQIAQWSSSWAGLRIAWHSSIFLRIDFFILRPHGELKLTNVEPVMNALQQGSRLSNLAALGEKLSPADKEMAEDIVKWPVVAQVEHPITINISTNNRYSASMAIYESHKVWNNFSVFGIDPSELPCYPHCICIAEW